MEGNRSSASICYCYYECNALQYCKEMMKLSRIKSKIILKFFFLKPVSITGQQTMPQEVIGDYTPIKPFLDIWKPMLQC